MHAILAHVQQALGTDVEAETDGNAMKQPSRLFDGKMMTNEA